MPVTLSNLRRREQGAAGRCSRGAQAASQYAAQLRCHRSSLCKPANVSRAASGTALTSPRGPHTPPRPPHHRPAEWQCPRQTRPAAGCGGRRLCSGAEGRKGGVSGTEPGVQGRITGLIFGLRVSINRSRTVHASQPPNGTHRCAAAWPASTSPAGSRHTPLISPAQPEVEGAPQSNLRFCGRITTV